MKDETTTNAIDDGRYRSPDEIIAALERFIKGPRIIGNLHGYLVYVDDSLPPGMIEIRAGENTMRFPVDHPYIQGTSLEKAARDALLAKDAS